MARKTTRPPKAAPRIQKASRKEPAVTKHQKPVFSVGTLFTLVLFAGLFTLAVYINKQKESSAEETPAEQISFIFKEADGAPASIEVKPATGETVKITRNSANAWAIKLPSPAEADQGLAEAAAAQVSALKVISPIDADPGIFGLDKPAYIITIEFEGGNTHMLEIGDSTPTNSGYYVRIDKDKMVITDLSGIDSLLQLGSFPPYLNTPTPSALPPTETPISPTQASPGSTVTPAP
jgi:hypothetical protein